jgi:hypothetical protein
MLMGLFGFFASIVARSEDFSWVEYSTVPGPGGGKHVVLVSGDEEYRSEESLPMLAKILSQRHGFRCTVLFPVSPDGFIDPNASASLDHAEAFDTADVIVMQIRFRKWSNEAMVKFDAAMRRGVSVVALRTSTHPFRFPEGAAFAHYNTFGKRVIGEDWVSHWGEHKKEGTRGVVEAAHAEDPVLRGVNDVFGDTDVYEVAPPADVRVLLRGCVIAGIKPDDSPADYRKKTADGKEQHVNDPMMPIAWTRVVNTDEGRTQRIFCTTMGAATDFLSEGLRRLVVNAVYWCADFNVPERADVRFVGEYRPTAYGFNGFRKQVKPSDHRLDR